MFYRYYLLSQHISLHPVDNHDDGDLQCAIDDTRDFDNAIVAHCFLFGTESFMTGSYICGYHHPKW